MKDKAAKSSTYYYVYLIQAINPSLYCTVHYKPLGNGCCTINAFLDSSNLVTLIQVTTWLWISVDLISNPCNN